MEFNKELYDKLKKNICDAHGVRFEKDDKTEFRKYIKKITDEHGVSYDETKYSDEQNTNIVIGDICNAKVILCAHYDTAQIFHYKALYENIKMFSKLKNIKVEDIKKILIQTIHPRASLNNYNDNSYSVMLVLMFLKNTNVSIILFDNEEKGRLGSKLFADKYAAKNNKQVFINFDCIGNGHFLILDYYIHNQELKKNVKNSFKNLRTIPSILFVDIPTDANEMRKYNIVSFSRTDLPFGLPF